MKVVVTGANGFVGRALVSRLSDLGHTVRAPVRRITEPRTATVEWLPAGDLTGYTAWPGLMDGIEAVVHLAALSHQIGFSGSGRASEFERVNAQLTRRVAVAARDAGVSRLVFLSSVAVVGSRPNGLVTESTPMNPDTDYGRSKLAAEIGLAAELGGSSVGWIVLRAPVVFGPGNPGNMGRLLRLINRNNVLPFGGIHNARSFIYIDNLIDAIVTVLNAPLWKARAYVVDDGTCYSTADLCRTLGAAAAIPTRIAAVPIVLLRMMGWAGDIAEFALRRSMPVSTYSIDRLLGTFVVSGRQFQHDTGWMPPITTTEAMCRTVAYMVTR